MTYHLKNRRQTVLNTLKNLEGEEQVFCALKHINLLDTAPWPLWLDKELIGFYDFMMITPRSLSLKLNEDTYILQQENLEGAVQDLLKSKMFLWRVQSEDSSDKLQFWKILANIIPQLSLSQRDPRGTVETQFPLVPAPESSLTDIQNVWISFSDEEDVPKPLKGLALILEMGVLFNIVSSELASAGHPHTADGASAVLREIYRSGNVMPGVFLDEKWSSWSIEKVMSTFADEHHNFVLNDMIEKTDQIMKEINTIGKDRILTVFEGGRPHRFMLTKDNQSAEEDNQFIPLALRSALILAMTHTGSLIVERYRGLKAENVTIRDIYSAFLGDQGWEWLDEEGCRSVHNYDYTTGRDFEYRDPGHVYRGWYEDFGDET